MFRIKEKVTKGQNVEPKDEKAEENSECRKYAEKSIEEKRGKGTVNINIK
jgi:C4-type Zn-finger protein